MAGSIKGIIVEIGGDTSGLQKALSKVNSATSSLSKELRGINSLLKLDPKNTELVTQKQQVLSETIKDTENKLKLLHSTYDRAVEAEANGSKISEENWRNIQREIINTENKLKTLKLEASNWTKAGKSIEEYGDKITKVSTRVENLGNKLTKVLTTSIVGTGVATVKSAMDFETAFTGVEKTVDATDEQLAELKQGIKDLAKEIPSSTTEISAVAEAAGQLGIQTENVLSFSKAMIDLGNSTNLTADEAASQLAKFANITQMSQKDFDKLGSSIVDLGNNYATTEADIVNMAMRLAGAGHQVGMSEGQILGLSTALSSVGIEAEMGGSAISKAMVKMQNAVEMGGSKLDVVLKKTGKTLRELELMSANDSKGFKELSDSIGMTSTEVKQLITAGTNLEDFASVSGMTAEQFKKAWKEDASGALSAFIQGLGNAQDKGESAITMLSEMGLTEVRLRDSLLRAANAGDLFNNAIETGTKAWDENTALTNEANKRYATLESRFKKTLNKTNNLAINLGEKLTPSINKLLDKADKFIERLDGMSEEETKNVVKVGLMVAAMGPLVKILGKTGSTLGNGVKAVGTFSRAIGVMKTGANSGVASVDKLATILGTISNPVGLATVGITALTAAMAAHIIKTQNEITSLGGLKKELDAQQDSWNNLKNARNENLTSSLTEISNIEKLSEELKKMTDANGQVKEGYEARANYIINELNNALGTEYKMNGNIIEQYSELKDGIDSIITKKKAEAYLNAYQEEYQTALKNSNEAMDSYVKLWEKYEEATKKYYLSSGVARVQASQEMATIQKELKEQSDMVNEYGQVIENYENLVSASASGSAETIEDAMKRMGQSYSEATGETKTSLTEQIQQYESYKEQIKNITSEALRNNKQYLMDMIADNANSNQQRLDDTIKSLREQTSAINGLTEDQKNAWKELARSDRQAYTETISKLDEDTRNTIEKATGIWVQDTGIEDAAKGLGEKAETGFRTHIDGKEWGMDLSSNIASGMTSQKSEMSVSNASSTVAGWIKKILGHSVPKAGPLKDELTYMPDMIENFSNGIDHNKAKLVKSIMNMTKEMQEKLKIVQLQNFGNLQGNLSNQVIDNTKTVFTTPQIVFNVQELDEAKLNQCFNYINRKFGSKY